MRGKVPRGIVNQEVSSDPRWHAKLEEFGRRFADTGEGRT
jgi:hypothetical protein